MTMVLICDCCGETVKPDGITRKIEVRTGLSLTTLDMCRECHDTMSKVVKGRFPYLNISEPNLFEQPKSFQAVGTTQVICNPGYHDMHPDRLDGKEVFRCTKCNVVANDERRV